MVCRYWGVEGGGGGVKKGGGRDWEAWGGGVLAGFWKSCEEMGLQGASPVPSPF